MLLVYVKIGDLALESALEISPLSFLMVCYVSRLFHYADLLLVCSGPKAWLSSVVDTAAFCD
jgi:hypothetical protein